MFVPVLSILHILLCLAVPFMLRLLQSLRCQIRVKGSSTPLLSLFSTTTHSRYGLPFALDESFLEKYKSIPPPFGYAPLGELVYRRTYSRTLEDGSKEDWWQTVQRVVEGTYSIQKEHINQWCLGWDEQRAQRSAHEMYDLIFNMKFLPPGIPTNYRLMHRPRPVGDGYSRCA